MLAAKREATCSEANPCRRFQSRCPRCAAVDHLTPDDWYVLEFYRRVEDQYINQGETGLKPPQPVFVYTPRIEGWKAVLATYEYDRALWPWLMEWGRVLFRLHRCGEAPAAAASRNERLEHYKALGVPVKES